jgi:hypothetical protein
MINALLPLWAAETIHTTFEWGRIQSNADWIPPVAICVAILLFVGYMYRRDAVELKPIWGWLLTVLRAAAFFGLLALYLQPHWRTEREEVRNSRVLLLADTSLSMGTVDVQGSASSGAISRSRQLIKTFNETDFLAQLRKTHDVVVVPFGEDLQRDQMTTLAKRPLDETPEDSPAPGITAVPAARGGRDARAPGPDWNKLLAPTGVETRLGQSLRQLIQEERETPVSAVVVFSDGGQNAGIAPEAAVTLAQEARIPVYTVGLGSDRQPTNVAVCDLAAPVRAYPGDHYTLTGYLQAQGMARKLVTVQVLSRAASSARGSKARGVGEVIASRQVTLGEDGEVLPVKFDLVHPTIGRRTLCLQIKMPKGDTNLADNSRETDIEIVDRKTRVLLLADGPMREYQFLRNQLYRDRYTTVDVLLQSGKPGMSQEAKKILGDFPSSRPKLFDYDCIVAFDPDWKLLKPVQIELLEKWVGEQGGGLIVLAGPVDACKGPDSWVHDPRMNLIRNLYPVEFPGRLAATENNMYSTGEPWPLDFTRLGEEADFLWLADSATASSRAWAAFPGVFSYCPVRGPKPAAAVYARFSDPRVAQNGEGPVYMAGQFYGAGSVFYLGSAEMWRLRAVDEAYFSQFYTKLIRHVSQGRLLRGSSRGVLLVGQDRYLLGNTVEVRAQLTNARLEPLRLPSINLQVTAPNGPLQSVPLRADSSRAGAYVGQFPALQEGTYRLELPVPESENERLDRRIQVKVPDLERENPRRNDAVLGAIAKKTGGKYYVGLAAAIAPHGTPPLVDELRDRTTTIILPVAPDPRQEEHWLRFMMIVLSGLLCLEWLIRRLLKLA